MVDLETQVFRHTVVRQLTDILRVPGDAFFQVRTVHAFQGLVDLLLHVQIVPKRLNGGVIFINEDILFVGVAFRGDIGV